MSNSIHKVKVFSISNKLKSVLIGIIIFSGSITACSTTESATEKSQTNRSTADLEALYWAKIDSTRMNFTQADVDFMTKMIGHHAQALVISRLAPKNNASRSIQTLAARIINAQNDEIATMQKWLRDRNQPVPQVEIDGLNLTVRIGSENSGMNHGGMSHGTEQDHSEMPGMLTKAQIEELATLEGADFDRTFLTYMIAHHEGAVTMVSTLFEADGAALDEESFNLASDIQVDQITEIERMKLMLENMTNS